VSNRREEMRPILAAIGALSYWNQGERFLFRVLLVHLGELAFQHRPDEPAGRVPLLFEPIQPDLQIRRQLNHNTYELCHGQTPR
jgi:hypothetical protein